MLWGMLCLLLLLPVSAQEKISKGPTPNWLRPLTGKPVTPNLDDISDGYYFELIEYQVNLGTQTEYNKTIKHIFDQAGVEGAGQVSVLFDPSYQQLVFHQVNILRDGKVIDKLKMSNLKVLAVETELSRYIYNGSKSAYLVIDDLRNGDKLEVSYSLQGFNPVFGGGFADSFSLQGSEPIGLIHVNYQVPSNRKLKFMSHNHAPLVKAEKIDNYKNYYWEMASTTTVDYEMSEPAWYIAAQWVECSEFKNWTMVAHWAHAVNPIDDIAPGSPLAALVEKLWEQAEHVPTRYLDLATNFVQNDIRYMGIETGEYSHRANKPEKVLAQRYGDCKDKSVLLATMLANKGIPVCLVLVNSNGSIINEQRLASPFTFNHMIVSVETPDGTMDIDPTLSNQGGQGMARYTPYYGDILRIKPNAYLTRSERPQNCRTEILETLQLEANDEATLTVKTSYWGGDADVIRNSIKQTAKNQIKKNYFDYYKRVYGEVTSNGNLRYEDDLKNNKFVVYESYKIRKLSQLDENTGKRFIPFVANGISEYLPNVSATQVSPVYLRYPIDLTYELVLINPNKKNAKNIYETMFVDRPDYRFGWVMRNSKDSLRITYKFGTHNSFIPSENIPQFRDDFAKRDDFLSMAIFVDKDGNLAMGKNPFQLQWIAVIAVLITLALAFFVLKKFYHWRSPSAIITPGEEPVHKDLGGLLFVLPVVLIWLIVAFGANFLSFSSYLLADTWHALSYLQGSTRNTYYLLLGFELLCSTLIWAGLIYSFVLLLQKRDLFPQTLLAVIVFAFAFVVIDYILTLYVHEGNELQRFFVQRMIVLLVVYGGICYYLYTSKRVKGTFVVPFRYRYQAEVREEIVEEEGQ